MDSPRRSPPPPLEGNDRLVDALLTAGWAAALIVLLIVRGSLPAHDHWWIWTCVTGVAFGVFGLWYVPRLKQSRARAVKRRPAADRPGAADAADDTDLAGRDGRPEPGRGLRREHVSHQDHE